MHAGTVTCTTTEATYKWNVEYDPQEMPSPVPGQKLKEFAHKVMDELEAAGSIIESISIEQDSLSPLQAE